MLPGESGVTFRRVNNGTRIKKNSHSSDVVIVRRSQSQSFNLTRLRFSLQGIVWAVAVTDAVVAVEVDSSGRIVCRKRLYTDEHTCFHGQFDGHDPDLIPWAGALEFELPKPKIGFGNPLDRKVFGSTPATKPPEFDQRRTKRMVYNRKG